MSIKGLVFGAVAAAVMFGAGTASAESIVQTQSNQTSFSGFTGNSSQKTTFAPGDVIETFKAFDTSLGTLNSVNIWWNISMAASVLTASGYGGGNMQAYSQGSNSFAVASGIYDSASLGLSVSSVNNDAALSGSMSVSSNKSFVVPSYSNDPVIEAAFSGGNLLSLTYGGNFGLSAYNIASGTIDINDTAILTYNYSEATPAVPEPETYAMLLAGLGALGFVARRRKAL